MQKVNNKPSMVNYWKSYYFSYLSLSNELNYTVCPIDESPSYSQNYNFPPRIDDLSNFLRSTLRYH